jgi:hypothetical protein
VSLAAAVHRAQAARDTAWHALHDQLYTLTEGRQRRLADALKRADRALERAKAALARGQ